MTPEGKAAGQQVTDRTLEELAQEFQGFDPPIFPTVERIQIADGREVLAVQVSKAARRPVLFRGVAYERVLNTTRAMSRELAQRLMLEELHAVERWENQPAADWTAARLDQREMVLTLEEAIRRGRCEDPGTRDPVEILRGLGLLLKNDALARAAVVLFAPNDQPLPDFPQLKLRVARFRGNDRDAFLDNRQFTGNAFALMRRAERFLLDNLPVAGEIIPGKMEREDRPLLPLEALREALANAFVHRDYAIGGGSVGVAIYDDRVEITSIGDLHFGFTPAALFLPHESKPWNPMIAGVFYRRGLIETWGRGTLKIARLMADAGQTAPRITDVQGAVTATFDLPGVAGKGVEKHVEKHVEKSQGASVKVPVKTSAKILAAIQAEPSISTLQLAELLGLKRRTIEDQLAKLKAANKIRRIGPDKGGHWEVP